MLEDLRGLGLPLELGFLLFCQFPLQIQIKTSAIYLLSIECMFIIFDFVIYIQLMLKFTFELVFMAFWPLMDESSHLKDQWPGLMMDGG